MLSDAAHQLNLCTGDQRGEYAIMHVSSCVLMLISPNFTFVWRGNYCPCQAARGRERRESSRLSTAVLWEPSPHTCYLIGPGGRRSERDPDSPTCSRQSRVHPSPPPLAKPCVNNTPLNDFLKLLAKRGEKATLCYTLKLFQRILMVLNMHLLFIFYFWTYCQLFLFIHSFICLFASFIVTVELELNHPGKNRGRNNARWAQSHEAHTSTMAQHHILN